MIKQFIPILIIIAVLSACTQSKQQAMSHEYTNDLIHETSPYLLQHAHNPVNWKAWNDESLNEAQDNNKLILISVGYSSCHWCHVMEHESFEDTLVASVMNKNFVNIKVDREERPDVDQVYMNAVQLMTGSGGWPLNVVALPDGRPVWGGTYFRKEAWIKALQQIAEVYQESPERLVEYADRLEQGIKSIDIVDLNPDKPEFHIDSVNQVVGDWSKQFDLKLGGPSRAPKFMMPNNLHFLMRYAHQTGNDSIMNYVNLTLTKMAFGGVFDQLGGGFARYSVDTKWHVPHFEKMLYDNGQLVSLYSDAYLLTGNSLYEEIVYKTLDFIERELTDSDGSFYSSLDADSLTPEGELEEGAFYVWTEQELRTALQEDFDLFAAYYNINDYGYWEKDNYVLIRNQDNDTFIKDNDLSAEDFSAKRKEWMETLLKLRDKRNRPRLDDKALTSWNALMLKGYADAYRVFGKKEYLDTALKNANFIRKIQIRDDGGLNHSFKDGKSTINGYLEDYAAVIDAFLALYEITLDQVWLDTSRNLANYAFDHFYDDSSKMFFFTSDEDRSLVVRNIEYRDNVIPASNSIMAKNLFKLSHYFDNQAYYSNATAMLNNVKPEIHTYPSGFSNWLDLMLNYTNNYYEVAIVGNEAKSLIKEMNSNYLPNILIVGSEASNDLPLLKNRYVEGETFVYVCVNKTCKLPVKAVEEALKLIDK